MTNQASGDKGESIAAEPPVGPAAASIHEAIAPASISPSIPQPSSKPDRPLERRRFFDDAPDKGLFLFFALLGFGIIFAVKMGALSQLFGFTRRLSDAFLAAFAACLLLLLYAFFVWRIDYFRLHADRLGDNCYYLGFVFTLASLATALVEIELHAADRGAVLQHLIGSFGVALLSTILGILLRVFFMQMRREVEDLEEDLRHDLQQRAQRLLDQLHQAVVDLESFRLRTRQVLEERLHEATETFSQAVKSQTTAVQRAVDDLTQRAQAVFASVLAVADDLNRNTAAINAAAADLARRLEDVEIPPDLLAAPARALRKRTETIANGVERLFEATERVTTAAGRLQTVLNSVEGGAQAMGRVATAIEPVATAVERLKDAMTRQVETVSELVRQAGTEAQAMRAHREAILHDLAASREALGRTQETLTEIVRVITDRLGG